MAGNAICNDPSGPVPMSGVKSNPPARWSLLLLDENARILVAGESALFSEESGFEDVSANENDLFWKNKSLVFEGEKLREVVRLLELNYQVSIEFSTKCLGNCRLTATFEDKSIEEVLEVIALTQGLELEDTPKGYKLIGEGCE